MFCNYKRKIVLVGPLPPPFTGQSIAFKMLVGALKAGSVPFEVVDLMANKSNLGGKTFLKRCCEYGFIISEYLRKALLRGKTVYITISQSRRGFLRDLFMIWFAWTRRDKIICHLYGGNYRNFYNLQPSWLKWLILRTLLRTKAVLVEGEGLRQMFDFDGSLLKKVHVVPNGMSCELRERCSAKKLPDNFVLPIRLLFLSNLIESKGYFDVLEAVNILRGEHNLNVKCDFCGEFMVNKPDDKRVKNTQQAYQMFNNYIASNRLEGNVVFNGVVSADDKQKMLEQAHVFILPTNYNNEGQPISIIEAIAYGCVVISTDYRAIPDMVRDGETGYLVRYGQPSEIAKCVTELVRSPGLYSQMSGAAIDLFYRKFTRAAYLNRILPFIVEGSEK